MKRILHYIQKLLKTKHEKGLEKLVEVVKSDFEQLSKLLERQSTFAKYLDLTNSIVYVTNMATNEIMFVNENAKNIFKDHEPIEGKTCYEVFQKDSHPCSFCNNVDLAQELEKPITWVYHNKSLDRTYLIEDIAYRVNGYIVRIEHATELTSKLKKQINGTGN